MSCCNIHFINEGVFQINTSQCGLTGFKQDYCPETLDRKLSLCAWTLLPESPEVLVVPDALQDVRLALCLPLWPTCLNLRAIDTHSTGSHCLHCRCKHTCTSHTIQNSQAVAASFPLACLSCLSFPMAEASVVFFVYWRADFGTTRSSKGSLSSDSTLAALLSPSRAFALALCKRPCLQCLLSMSAHLHLLASHDTCLHGENGIIMQAELCN